jgi:hypothetical protein
MMFLLSKQKNPHSIEIEWGFKKVDLKGYSAYSMFFPPVSTRLPHPSARAAGNIFQQNSSLISGHLCYSYTCPLLKITTKEALKNGSYPVNKKALRFLKRLCRMNDAA